MIIALRLERAYCAQQAAPSLTHHGRPVTYAWMFTQFVYSTVSILLISSFVHSIACSID